MAFDGMVTRSVITELNQILIGGKINKVYQPSKNEILLGIYANGKNVALLIQIEATNCRMHLTTNAKANPLQALNFCMLLRKHLIGYRILSIENEGLERVVKIELEGYDELNDKTKKILVVELMGKHSNVILLNQNNKIIDGLRRLDQSVGSYREILPAHEYCELETTKKDFLQVSSFEQFYSQIQKELGTGRKEEIQKAITNTYTGISNCFIEYLMQEKQEIDLNQIYEEIKKVTEGIGTNKVSYISYSNEKGKEDYVVGKKRKQELLEINFSLDDFYHQKEKRELCHTYRNQILKRVLEVLKKYDSRLKKMDEKLEEAKKKDQYQLYGELITSNLYQLKEENKDSVIVDNYYIPGQKIEIPLDKKLSISGNAKKYFKLYHKLKNAIEIVKIQKEETKKEVAYIESIVYELESAKSIQEIAQIDHEISENLWIKEKKKEKKKGQSNKKKETADSINECKIEDHIVWIGKNNKQNDQITTKLAKHSDLWFHTKEIHGSHVVLKLESKEELSQTLIEKVAQIAAFHSKAKLSQNVPVDYCYIKDVKKPSGSKPGMVIYKNNKTIYVNPKQEEN